MQINCNKTANKRVVNKIYNGKTKHNLEAGIFDIRAFPGCRQKEINKILFVFILHSTEDSMVKCGLESYFCLLPLMAGLEPWGFPMS